MLTKDRQYAVGGKGWVLAHRHWLLAARPYNRGGKEVPPREVCMHDERFEVFLQAVLPEFGYRWEGFRHVYGQVRKRLQDRMVELGVRDLGAYRQRLAERSEERDRFDAMCRITISRFYRDPPTFEALRVEVLPELARRVRERRDCSTAAAWSAGAASGEEPYTLRLCWDLDVGRDVPDVGFDVRAAEADAHMLRRARRALYPASTLENLPRRWIGVAFEWSRSEEEYRLRDVFREVSFEQRDIRNALPERAFDLVACRNLAFTYFDEEGQRDFLNRVAEIVRTGGALVIGRKEKLPEGGGAFEPWCGEGTIFRRC